MNRENLQTQKAVRKKSAKMNQDRNRKIKETQGEPKGEIKGTEESEEGMRRKKSQIRRKKKNLKNGSQTKVRKERNHKRVKKVQKVQKVQRNRRNKRMIQTVIGEMIKRMRNRNQWKAATGVKMIKNQLNRNKSQIKKAIGKMMMKRLLIKRRKRQMILMMIGEKANLNQK